jgi:hypothetical protein
MNSLPLAEWMEYNKNLEAAERWDNVMEIPLKPKHLHPFAKKIGSKSSISGATGGKKGKATNGLAAVARGEAQKAARQATKDNMMVMVLLPSGKRRFVRKADLK